MDTYLEWGFMGREMAFEEGLLLLLKKHKMPVRPEVVNVSPRRGFGGRESAFRAFPRPAILLCSSGT